MAGRNLVEDGSLAAPGVMHGDPLLAQLALNGAERLTHRLLPGSKAIDAGVDTLALDPGGAPLAFDERGDGFSRIVGPAVDLGAFEVQTILGAAITPVAPDPLDSPVEAIEIIFGEPVAGFDLGDLNLERSFDGKGDLLAFDAFGPTPVLTTSDQQMFLLTGLASRTTSSGDYTLTIDPVGAGIVGSSGAPLLRTVRESWTNTSTTDLDPPTVRVTPVSPDPTTIAVDAIEIVFSEPVVGFELADLILDQAHDGIGNLLTGAESLASSDGQTFVLSGLALLTADFAMYVLSLNAAASGVTDLAGNPLSVNASEQWILELGEPATVESVPASSDPRLDSAIASIAIALSETFAGLGLSDFHLDHT